MVQLSDEESAVAELESAAAAYVDNESVDRYVMAARRLPLSTSTAILRRMIRCVDDRERGEAQYELIEACERFPDFESYVETLVDEFAALYSRSPFWSRLMMTSITNVDGVRAGLVHAINALPVSKKTAVVEFFRREQVSFPNVADVLRRLEQSDS